MTTYASYAPATTNIWADNMCICFGDTITSLVAGVAVFSILGNMADRQRTVTSNSAPLRVALCEANELELSCPTDCTMCGGNAWMNLAEAECCGAFRTATVSAQSFILAFSVSCPGVFPLQPKHQARCLSRTPLSRFSYYTILSVNQCQWILTHHAFIHPSGLSCLLSLPNCMQEEDVALRSTDQ
jgi:hypothetical protein